tara:strand:- start:234 stop:515 length:282 start_codon:yes stop_codon:yes gene_type:complete
MIPLLGLGIVGITEYVNNLLTYDTVNSESLYHSLTREILLIMILPLFWMVSFFRSNLPKKSLFSTMVLISWSFVLWQGILLGYLDALFRRNGH